MRIQGVSTRPGAIALTRISGPSARARPTVIAFRAPFEAMYAIDEPEPMIDDTDDTFTTAAPGWRRSSGTSARTIWYGPITFTS